MSQTNLPKVSVPDKWTFAGNDIDAQGAHESTTTYGVWLYYVDNNRDDLGIDHFNIFSGGSVSNVDVGFMLKNTDTDPATNFGTSALGAHAEIGNLTITVNPDGTGIRLLDDPTWTASDPAP